MSGMRPEIKELWLEKLRSGKYAQTKVNLRNQDGYCCLGVLCDLYAEQKSEDWVFDDLMPFAYFLDEYNTLPDEVVEWAGLRSSDPAVPVAGIDDTARPWRLSVLNDRGKSFTEIADLIDQSL